MNKRFQIPAHVAFCGWVACILLAGVALERYVGRIPPAPPEEMAESADDSGFGARSTEWPKVRAAVLRHNPNCAACGSDREMNVHHIEPYHTAPELELDRTNLIPLCRTCHFFLGHDPDGPDGPQKPDWKKANPNVKRDAANNLRRVRR
jgi:hypothetical protein